MPSHQERVQQNNCPHHAMRWERQLNTMLVDRRCADCNKLFETVTELQLEEMSHAYRPQRS